jgi:Flp pilus assembly protein TadD
MQDPEQARPTGDADAARGSADDGAVSARGPADDGAVSARGPADDGAAYAAFTEGSSLLASSNPHAAAVALERARDLEPEQGSIREALGRAYFRCGRFRAARSEFARAVELDPVNDYAHFGLGLASLRVGDHIGARRHLKLAVAMRPREEYREALAQVSDQSA